MTMSHQARQNITTTRVLGLSSLLLFVLGSTSIFAVTTVSQPAAATPATSTTSASTPVASRPMTLTAPVTSVPLDQANMNDDQIMKWATNAAQSVYSYDFKNNKTQIQNNQQYFTKPGWKAFNDALAKSNNLKIVQEKKLVASASPGKPFVSEEGVKNGRYSWKVQLPLVATYENESKVIKQNLMVTLLIQRANDTPSGVGISHFVAEVVPENQLATTPASGSTAQQVSTTSSPSIPQDQTSSGPTPATTMPSSTTTTAPSSTTTTTTPSGSTPHPMNNPLAPRRNPGSVSTTPATTTTAPSNHSIPTPPMAPSSPAPAQSY